MKARNIVLPAVLILAFAALSPVRALAETLAWDAVTTYTDGSSIGSTPVTYTAVWSTSSSLASPATLAASISATSTAFSIATAGMPRGSTVYFGVRATVNGVTSSYSSAMAWAVPAIAPTLTPSSP
ncbi:MAG: hypothetical protein FIA93_07480, partial [Deltaproteobacteria bacterium]|nr:hypothetical protein [Deltaproteobacteria bacterium]